MRAVEFTQLDEGWKDQMANAAMAAAITTGAGGAGLALKDVGKDIPAQEPAKQTVQVAPQQAKADLSKIEVPKKVEKPKPQASYKPLTDSPNEMVLAKTAQANGITGVELAAFMAQMAHESQNFRDMVEDNPNLKKYAKGPIARALGNKGMNDAERFIGRGFVQLTGRYNYKQMEKALGIDLTSTWSKAHQASKPEIAAQIAVAYWKSRVAPKVSDWSDIRQVTKPINSGLHGLEHRQVRFDKIAKGMGLEV